VCKSRSAFTLFEMVLVLAVLVVLAAVTYPAFDAMYGGYRVTGAADVIRAAWASARAHALDEGRPYRFAVVPGKGNYRIAPDSPEFWTGNGPQQDGPNPAFVLEEALQKVRFVHPDALRDGGTELSGDASLPVGSIDPGMWSLVATFMPDGSAREDIEIVLHGRGARPLLLKLRGLTGVVTTKSLD
jgi:prepilin-type N-terminal cleavage/methylation domain-containing protein